MLQEENDGNPYMPADNTSSIEKDWYPSGPIAVPCCPFRRLPGRQACPASRCVGESEKREELRGGGIREAPLGHSPQLASLSARQRVQAISKPALNVERAHPRFGVVESDVQGMQEHGLRIGLR